FQPAPARTPKIFMHGQSIDITNPTTVQIARSRMMNGMGPAPKIIWRQRKRADHAPDPVVRLTVGEESAMATVVLDHKQADEKSGGRNCDEQRGPGIAQRESEPSCGPQNRQRQKRDRQLGNAARVIWLAIAAQNLCPAARFDDRQT